MVIAGSEASSRLMIRVWDWPTRICHGSIVFLVAGAWWTATNGQLQWHRRIGLTLLGVLSFRLLWGVFGGSTARFSSFVRGPAAVGRYARDLAANRKTFVVGHNPLGGWSVVAMLAALVGQVTLGLFAVDADGLESGPLAAHVSFEAGRAIAHWHRLGFDVLVGLVALHLCAVLVYALRRDDMIGPMIGGLKAAPAGVEPMRAAPRWRAAMAMVLAIALARWIATGCPV